MISIYLDLNIIVQIKNNSHSELKRILGANRFLIPFSTAHIADIFSSYSEDQKQLELINSDLEFISLLSKNYCLLNDGKEVKLIIYDPKDLFQQRIDQKDLLKNFSLDKLRDILNGNELTKDLSKQLIETIKNVPLDKAFADALTNPKTSEHLNSMFLGLKDNPTMEGFFKCFGEMITRLNETKDYKQLRKMAQSGLGINRDSIYDSDTPFETINKAYGKFNINPRKFKPETKYAPEWFDEISNEYLRLDMHGYQEDKVNTKKGRKETFRNTTEDSFHAAFASTCNYYITNDHKSYEKTRKVYERLSIDTLVFKPDEFVEHYKNFLFERENSLDLEIPLRLLDATDYSEKITDEGLIRTYYVPYFLFDFFNKMIVFIKSEQVTMVLLSQISPTNKGITYFFEIEELMLKLFRILGKDSKGQEKIMLEELQQDDWPGLKWNFENVSFRFIRTNGHYQLYYDYPESNG